MAEAIYLDNNATTGLDPFVIDAMLRELHRGPSNPSSQHAAGQFARRRLDEATEQIGTCLGSRLNEPGSARLIYTSGGTEANNLALRYLRGGTGPLIVSSVEHPSVLAVAQREERRGRPVRYLRVDQNGVVDLELLESWLSESASGQPAEPNSVVSIMSANNETGVVQPLERISELCRAAGAALHVDATQSVTKMPLELDSLAASAVTMTPHKFHGPVGVGVLWVAANETLEPLMYGGQQQLGTRPGTEPLALVVGMSEAVRRGVDSLAESSAHMRSLRDQLEQSLLDEFHELIVHASQAARLPNTSNISFVGANRQSMLMALDLAGIACSSGSACTSGSSPPSHVLTAMGASHAAIESAIRFGVSRFTTADEIERSVEIISRCYKRLRR